MPALARPTWRSTPRLAPALAAGAGLLLAASARVAEAPPDALSGLMLMRVTALLGALGLAFLLDDRARGMTETAPVPRPVRVGLRLVAAVPLAALWWTVTVLLVPAGSRPPLLPLTLEAGAMATTALAVATARVRFTDAATPGGGAAIGTLTAVAVAVMIPARWGLFALPDEPHWAGAHWRWALVLAVTVLACGVWTPQPLGRRARQPFGQRPSRPSGSSGLPSSSRLSGSSGASHPSGPSGSSGASGSSGLPSSSRPSGAPRSSRLSRLPRSSRLSRLSRLAKLPRPSRTARPFPPARPLNPSWSSRLSGLARASRPSQLPRPFPFARLTRTAQPARPLQSAWASWIPQFAQPFGVLSFRRGTSGPSHA
ncbi:hypothetical protein IAG44_22230 [Streptomyces roseirectus]|uniref:ABC transporter n=1 Tax=Streptomyces roseirectus TaxID=2768066 RepID=A0A7H0IGE6_9ACTN|nr:hypothetical protein [Streptomyces roseirectus]QNP71862.1 hypothetical protein IAG44_22230 [Streptomyces roseirectus]